MSKMISRILFGIGSMFLMMSGGVGYAADDTAKMKADIEELKKQVRDATEWRNADSQVHLAGYGSAGYTDRRKNTGTFQVFSFSPIFHYQYKDLLMMEAEVEMGYNQSGETETTLEYAALDLFLNDYAALVAGQFLSPIGQFRQNMHPAWVNKMPAMPVGFTEDGAIPLSETGVELRGGFPVGGQHANYAVYLGNGPKLENNAGELVVKTEGNSSDANNNKTVGGRFGYLPMSNLEIGVSAAAGKANLSGEADRDYNVYDVDFALQPSVVDLRGEYVKTKVGSDPNSAIPEAHSWKAWYLQASHKFTPGKWEAVARAGRFNMTGADAQKQTAIGANYLFANNVIGKMAYEFNSSASGTAADENRVLLQLAYGF